MSTLHAPLNCENEEDSFRMQEECTTNKTFPSAASVDCWRCKRQAEETPAEKVKVSKYVQVNEFEIIKPKKSINPVSSDVEVIYTHTERKCTNINDDNVYYRSIMGSIVEVNVGINAAPTHSQQTTLKDQLNIPPKSYLLSSTDSDYIHKENVEKLSCMSEQQILEEQQKLITTIRPLIKSFLKNKGEHSKPSISTLPVQVHSVDDSLWDDDVLSHPQIYKWLNHFNDCEKDKFASMKRLTDAIINDPEIPHEARFNCQGYLIPYTIENTEKTNEDDPHGPCYTASDLSELTRSYITEKKVISLNIMAGTIEYYMAGAYKDIMDLPLTRLFFVLRLALDDHNVIVLEATLKALRNLFYNRTDEASLDALVGFEEGVQQPCLQNNKIGINDLIDNKALLDHFEFDANANMMELMYSDLAEIDLITAACRTNIILRIQKIFSSLKPSFNCVHYSLQILIRLARDSVEMAHTIIETEHLMDTIVQNFIPDDINISFEICNNKTPVFTALKLLRVTSLQSQEICNILVKRHEVLKPISAYVNSSVAGTYGLRMQIEAYCILSNLLQYGCGVDTAMALFPVLVTTLFRHVKNTDVLVDSSVLSATHASAVIRLLNTLFKQVNNVQLQHLNFHLQPLLLEGFKKWYAQVFDVNVFILGHLRLLCSITDCYRTLVQNEPNIIQSIVPSLKHFSTSSGYNLMLSELLHSSKIISTIDYEHVNTNENLVNLATSAIVDSSYKIIPILNTSSPIPFFGSLFKLLECMRDGSLSDIYAINMWMYLEQIKTKAPHLCDNWFTRTEVDFLFSIFKLLCFKEDLNKSEKDLLYAVSYKLCYILSIAKKVQLDFLFDNIIFNKNFISDEHLMETISLSESNLPGTIFSVNEIKSLYAKVINVVYKDTGPNIVLKKWQQPILPQDWIYLPILNLYNKSQDTVDTPELIGEHTKDVQMKKSSKEKNYIISNNLQWIIFNEQCFPDLITHIDITDKLCRIMCVFLCDNSLFLNENIKALLTKCIQILFKFGKEKFNFSNPLTGISNFQNFYTKFLEQFKSVGCGDLNFTSLVLVPLVQKHDIQWRKLFWSEYMSCLRVLDCPEEHLCYDLKEYLYPEETDLSLLKSYFNAFSANLLRPNTIAHTIARHHVTSFINRGSSIEM